MNTPVMIMIRTRWWWQGPLLLTWINFNSSISNHMSNNGWDEITGSFPNFNDCGFIASLYTAILIWPSSGGSTTRYSDALISAMASQITSVSIVYSTVRSGTDPRKHQSSASLAFFRGIHRWPVNSHTKGQWRGICYHLMTSSRIIALYTLPY